MPNSTPRRGIAITLIGVHTSEGPNPSDVFPDLTAENLARWMTNNGVSYHKIVDDDSVVNFVPDHEYSWSLRSGNARSLNICFVGRASWDRAEWLRHDRALRMAAKEVKDWCNKHGLPKVKLTSAQVATNHSGIIGHVNWTEGKKDGSHTDPGPHFPWDVFMRYVNEGDDELTPDEKHKLDTIYREITMLLPNRDQPGQDRPTDTVLGYAASASGRALRIERMLNRIEQVVEAVVRRVLAERDATANK